MNRPSTVLMKSDKIGEITLKRACSPQWQPHSTRARIIPHPSVTSRFVRIIGVRGNSRRITCPAGLGCRSPLKWAFLSSINQDSIVALFGGVKIGTADVQEHPSAADAAHHVKRSVLAVYHQTMEASKQGSQLE